jgi:hypothetical protein
MSKYLDQLLVSEHEILVVSLLMPFLRNTDSLPYSLSISQRKQMMSV